MGETSQETILRRVGGRVKAMRRARGLTVKGLAQSSGLSPRFISQLEAGQGNIAIGRLHMVASALGVGLVALVDELGSGQGLGGGPSDAEMGEGSGRNLTAGLREGIHQILDGLTQEDTRRALAALEALFGESRPQVVALLGLRGAGKSSVGQEVAASTGVPFVELDEQIEGEAGLTLEEVFALHGEPYYRRLEARCMMSLLADRRPAVVALSGGIVHNEDAFETIRRRCVTVWLKARPLEHMSRVQAQGDHRPMANRSDAMAELRAILKAREPLYRLADYTVDTSGRSVHDVASEIVRLV